MEDHFRLPRTVQKFEHAESTRDGRSLVIPVCYGSGSWESRTDWHRCVAFEKLASFGGTLTKGAHVAIEGELRSREYDREVTIGAERTTITQRVWEIRVDTILKLDRAARGDEPADTSASEPL